MNEWRDYLFRHGASFCGVSETWLWGECMSDARFQWLRGPERPPHAATSRVRGGMGALVPRALEAAVVRTDTHSFWVRLTMREARRPLFVCTVYAPQRTERAARDLMWTELSAAVGALRPCGELSLAVI